MLGFGNNNGGRAPDLAGVEITGELERVTLWHNIDAVTPGLLFMLKGKSHAFRAAQVSDLDTLSKPGDHVKFRVLPAAPGESPYVAGGTFKNLTLEARDGQPTSAPELSLSAKH